jgi:hypothetical protein
MHKRAVLAILAILTSTSCRKSDQADLEAAIASARLDARALVHTDGCTVETDCAAAAVGEKACGGPREYWVYCKKTTDEKALLPKLDVERSLEHELNVKFDVVGDCASVLAPTSFVIANGQCAVAPQ